MSLLPSEAAVRSSGPRPSPSNSAPQTLRADEGLALLPNCLAQKGSGLPTTATGMKPAPNWGVGVLTPVNGRKSEAGAVWATQSQDTQEVRVAWHALPSPRAAPGPS